MGPFPIPTINTALLLTSGVTLTIAHHALRAGQRGKTAFWLFLTVLLGATFMGFQVYEYIHAYTELNLKLTSGIYGSTFFMLTGFHGFHVTIGAIMLSVVLYRDTEGPLYARASFRVRRSGLVLALRRRGLAGPVRGGVLAVERFACAKKAALRCGFFTEGAFSGSWHRAVIGSVADAGRLDPAKLVGDQYQQEQRDRKADAHGQRLHGAVAFSLVVHQEEQGRSQAGEDQDERDGDDDFQGESEGSGAADGRLSRAVDKATL